MEGVWQVGWFASRVPARGTVTEEEGQEGQEGQAEGHIYYFWSFGIRALRNKRTIKGSGSFEEHAHHVRIRIY